MRRALIPIFAAAFLCLAATGYSQVTNLKINGSSGGFTATQGDSIWWEYNVPSGAGATGNIWIDINGNGSIDEGTDKLLFGNFTETDGDMSGHNGPPDLDGAVNGHVFFGFGNSGLAPAKYIIKFSHNGTSQQVTGTIAALPSPTYTISGTVTPPSGRSPLNILVVADRSGDNGGPGWMALTDASGDYSINFNASAGNQDWRVQVSDEFPPYTSPARQTFYLDNSFAHVDFAFGTAAAKVVGYLKGEDSHVFSNTQVRLEPWSESGGGDDAGKTVTTDGSGFYVFGLTSEEVNAYPVWRLSASSDVMSPHYFSPQSGLISVHNMDSLRVDLTAFVADDSITGRVYVDGQPPNGMVFNVYAGTQDSGWTGVDTDPVTGNFVLHVTKKIANYYVGGNSVDGYATDNSSQQVHAGATGVTVDFVKLVWTAKGPSGFYSYYSLAFPEPNTGWVGGMLGTMLRTTNGGDNWTTQTTNTSYGITGISAIDVSHAWFAAEDGVLKYTSDGGAHWNSQNSGTTSKLTCIQFVDANHGWVGMETDGSGHNMLRTTNGGASWAGSNTGGNGVLSIFFINGSMGWMGEGGGLIQKTTDGGATWTFQNSNQNCGISGIHFADALHGWATTQCGNIIGTTDGGANWASQANGGCGMMAVFAVSPTEGWGVGQCGRISSTVNGGAHWSNISNNSFGTLYAVKVFSDGSGWAVGDVGTILHKPGRSSNNSCDLSLLTGWNMVSIPYTMADARKTTLFPGAISNAYSYSVAGGYASRDTLKNKLGYWLKYAGPAVQNLQGEWRAMDTIPVSTGWNLIGSVSGPVLKGDVMQSTPGMVQSPYYIFAAGYASSDTLKPGRAYWVKSNQAGYLILNAPASLMPLSSAPIAIPASTAVPARKYPSLRVR